MNTIPEDRTKSAPLSGTGPTAHTSQDSAKKSGEALAEDAKNTARNAISDASDTAMSHAQSAKASVADEVSDVASALRTAADEMRRGSPQERTFAQLADGLADASEVLRDKDLGTLTRDVTRLARENPMAFLGGAALVGFAAARFAKASETDGPAVRTTAATPPVTRGGMS